MRGEGEDRSRRIAAEGGRRDIEHRRGRERRSDAEGKGKIDPESQMAVRIQEVARDETQDRGRKRKDVAGPLPRAAVLTCTCVSSTSLPSSPSLAHPRAAEATTCHRYEHHF